ncbi:dihydroneopterin aldolase [Parachlamydia sp. AcF125]|uniref:dihydroneopterin aldolase n=1 Tax=Parachlamydia sp. AcF125 TaxID=2795736 RepID=UPI001BC9A84B|nr:dihydroneopterin aldolase [Parachlamydia sp. AcF125]MBS4168923.1 Dihydroneopterin aldolase [Parachlamydia sp. AcF125]
MLDTWTYPITTVGGLIVAADGDVLLVYSSKWSHCYTTPGGKVELGESREAAFVREIKEETGLEVTNIRFISTQESIYSPEFKEKKHFIMNDFIADLAPGYSKEDVVLNEEAESYVWVSVEEAKKLPLNRETRYLLNQYAHSLQKSQYGLIGFENHQIPCIIGILPHERTHTQTIFVDLKVEADFRKCALSDDIVDTVDYVALANVCSEFAQKRGYMLIEKYAYDVLQKLLHDYPINWAWIKVKKPEALSSAEFTTVELKLCKKEQ